MPKLNNTPIKPYLFIHRTRKVHTILAGLALWTILTSLLTFAAINSKYFHNTYQCQSIQIQPIKTLTKPIDEKQSKLISRISSTYNIPKHRAYEVVGIVKSYTRNQDFPNVATTLAVIATESSFRMSATSSAEARGLMQITKASGKNSTYEIWSNIRGGVELLKEYREQLGSDSAAIQAYNVGLTSYRKGVRAPEYLEKVKNNLKLFESV